MAMRTIKSLATELGYTERTFHRKLEAGDAKACLALRQEVIEENIGVQQSPETWRSLPKSLSVATRTLRGLQRCSARGLKRFWNQHPAPRGE